MKTRRLLAASVALAAIALPLTLLAQPKPIPAQPTPRQGQILDVRADKDLAALPVARLMVDIDHQPAQQATAALSAGGIATTLRPGPYRNLDAQTVTLHLNDAPYMEALMEFRQQLRARITDSAPGVVNLMYEPKEEVPPWCIAGPFVVQYYGMSNEVSVPFDIRTHEQGKPAKFAYLRMDVLAQPGINIIQSMQDVKCTGVEDDKHQPIVVGGPKQRGDLSRPPAQITLTLPDAPGRRIPLLKGTVDARIVETVQLDLATLTEKHTPALVEGMDIEISALTPRNGSTTFFNLTIQYSRGSMLPEKWAQVGPLLSTGKLKIAATGSGTISASTPGPGRGGAVPVGDDVKLQYVVTVAQNAGRPGKATLEVPIGMTDLRVPFEFKDVLIP